MYVFCVCHLQLPPPNLKIPFDSNRVFSVDPCGPQDTETTTGFAEAKNFVLWGSESTAWDQRNCSAKVMFQPPRQRKKRPCDLYRPRFFSSFQFSMIFLLQFSGAWKLWHVFVILVVQPRFSKDDPLWLARIVFNVATSCQLNQWVSKFSFTSRPGAFASKRLSVQKAKWHWCCLRADLISWGHDKRKTQKIVYPPWNSHFAPEDGWLEYDCFLLGPGLLSGAFAVSFWECNCCCCFFWGPWWPYQPQSSGLEKCYEWPWFLWSHRAIFKVCWRSGISSCRKGNCHPTNSKKSQFGEVYTTFPFDG